ncbi:MAG: hypothetical protein RMK57_03150 [Bryobacterales bacterium]|nr:carboxypeptidase-like regulatory domain-containing protein [Bryobacteraceae bacterium]MDW8353505.1 hypothetical protein [Bryobacterales bacterium]
MRRSILMVLCLLAIGALPVAADEDEDLTRLTIEVRNIYDKPIERASVIVRFVEGRSIRKFGKKVRTEWQLRTNQEGIAKIPPIPQGDVLVQVIAKGYQTFGQKFRVEEDERTIVVKLNPPQPQFSSHQ